jgi:2-polyprenyl-3-methyl-5-hydroxy-6-metoxy-1,4-benzoquinol methylase
MIQMDDFPIRTERIRWKELAAEQVSLHCRPFKEVVHSMSEEEFTAFYETLKCWANIRPTDCSEAGLNSVMQRIDIRKNKSLLDVGCGRGHCIEKFLGLGLNVTRLRHLC